MENECKKFFFIVDIFFLNGIIYIILKRSEMMKVELWWLKKYGGVGRGLYVIFSFFIYFDENGLLGIK